MSNSNSDVCLKTSVLNSHFPKCINNKNLQYSHKIKVFIHASINQSKQPPQPQQEVRTSVCAPYELIWTSAAQVYMLFLTTLQQCFKLAMVTSAPKSSNPSCLNDYRPVALIYVAMKALEHSLTIWTLYTTGGGKPLCM